MEYVCKLAWWMYRIVKDQIRKHPILIPAEEVQPVFNEIHDFFSKGHTRAQKSPGLPDSIHCSLGLTELL